MAWSLKKAMGWDAPRTTLQTEIVPGTAKPSIILLDMAIAKLTKDLDKLKIIKEDTYSEYTEYAFKQAPISFSFRLNYRHASKNARFKEGVIENISISIGDNAFAFTPDEKRRITVKLRSLASLRNDFIEQKKEETRQQEAVSLIEEFFKPKLPKPVEPEVEPLITVIHSHIEMSNEILPKSRKTKKSPDQLSPV